MQALVLRIVEPSLRGCNQVKCLMPSEKKQNKPKSSWVAVADGSDGAAVAVMRDEM